MTFLCPAKPGDRNGASLRRRSRAVAVLLILSLLTGSSGLGVAESGDCSQVIEDAESLYYDGRFDPAIDALNRCLSDGAIPLDEREQAFRVLGLCYLAKDYVDQARGSIEELLFLVPDWKPDPDQDPQAFQMLVSDVKNEMKKTQGSSRSFAKLASSRKFWLYGALAAIGVGLLAVVGGGDGESASDDDDLPAPPILPE